jgi:hypothetical protein
MICIAGSLLHFVWTVAEATLSGNPLREAPNWFPRLYPARYNDDRNFPGGV